MSGEKDYPVDEYTWSQSFDSKDVAEKYFSFHFDNFVTKGDIVALKNANVSHIKVPIPHWIKGDN